MNEEELAKKLASYKTIIKTLIGIISVLVMTLFAAVGWIYTQKIDIDNLKNNYAALKIEVKQGDSDVKQDIMDFIQDRLLTRVVKE